VFLADAYRKIFSADGSPNLSDCALGVIGLEIVRNIAEKTNCLFEVDSDEKRPTVLRLTVPVGRSEQREEGFKPSFTPHISNGKKVSGSDSNRELLILLSDDDKEERSALEELLKYSNIKIVPTSNNASLLSLAAEQNKKADGVIISAPFQPEYPARHLISGLRRAVGKSTCPVIVVVSEHSPELANELSAIDGVCLLVQPLNFAQMANILRENSTGEE
jgi:PleD family two-component response regulator